MSPISSDILDSYHSNKLCGISDELLSSGWTSLFGAVALLVLANKRDLTEVFERVEWVALIFFAALFVVMGALSELGLLQFLGDQTEACIMAIGERYRLVSGVIFVMWVSARLPASSTIFRSLR